MESTPRRPSEQPTHPSHRTIVVGHDGSRTGTDALRLGQVLAEALGAALLVARVLVANGDHRRSRLAGSSELPDVDVLGTFGTRAVESVADSPADGLLALAGTVDPIAIVIGTGSRAGGLRASGTAEALAHDGSIPIGVAPAGYAAREDLRLLDIAVAFDGSDESWPAVTTGSEIATSTHGILSILTADGMAEPPATAPWSKLAAGALESEARRARSRTLQTALSITPASLPTQGWLLHGEPSEALAAISEQFDLLVTGSRGHGPARRTLFGSTTRSLAARSSCPLMVVPRSGGPNPLGADWPIGPGVLRRDLAGRPSDRRTADMAPVGDGAVGRVARTAPT